MKYIFDLYWFNNGGKDLFGITPKDYQDEPLGGWQNWTAQWNVDYMLRMIGQKESFMLVGDLHTLRGQAKNAGSPNTRCMVGAEVLLLVSAGYGSFYPPLPEFGGKKHYIRRFDPKNKARDDHQSIVNDACKYLSGKKNSHHFWLEQRKQEYMTILH
jgi:hypothetical protein